MKNKRTVQPKVNGLEPNWRSFEPYWTVQDKSERSFEQVDGHGSKLTAIRQKVDGPDELKDISVQVDGPRILMNE